MRRSIYKAAMQIIRRRMFHLFFSSFIFIIFPFFFIELDSVSDGQWVVVWWSLE